MEKTTVLDGRTLRLWLILALLATLVAMPQRAFSQSEAVNHNYGSHEAPYNIIGYSRVDATLSVHKLTKKTDLAVCNNPNFECRNFQGSYVTADIRCGGVENDDTNGGWVVQAVTGQCFTQVEVCQYVGTPAEICNTVTGAPTLPSNVDLTPQVCATPDPVKNYCSASYDGEHMAGGLYTGITGNTGDDMFKIEPGTSGFFEYAAIAPAAGGTQSGNRLRYIERDASNGTRAMMMPSGPPATYTDYQRFLAVSPASVTHETACYAVDVDVCSAVPTAVAIPANGICGVANGAAPGSYASYASIPAADLCGFGSPFDDVETTTEISWKCAGVNGGAPKQCSVLKGQGGVCGPADLADPGVYASLASIPSSDLCSVGSVVNASENATTISWYCDGVHGGPISPLCDATKPADGVCGVANGAQAGTYASLASIPPAAFCQTGAPIAQLETATEITWECDGLYGGAPSGQCLVGKTNAGICGAADTVAAGTYASLASIPTSELCSVGAAINTSESATTISWTCEGMNGGPNSPVCDTDKQQGGVCGAANTVAAGTYTSLASIPTSELCSVGAAINTSENATTISWTCEGINGGPNSPVCDTDKQQGGVCGAANTVAAGT
ncbi:MAG: hypothetical protein ACPGRX_08095, partial [Bdellovibrionales bacterium]